MTKKKRNPVINIGSRVIKATMSASCGFGAAIAGSFAYRTKSPVAIGMAAGLGLSSLTLAGSAILPEKDD